MDTLRRSAYLRATTLFSWMITPTFVALFTFLTFTLAGNEVPFLSEDRHTRNDPFFFSFFFCS